MTLPARRTLRVCLACLLVVFMPLVAGCETAPGTGRTFFTGGMSAKDEIALGAQEHEKIVPEFGGVYEDPQLAAYVGSIGTLLAHTSETPDLKFTFTVLDTPIVNAFALPGGYVYVTRGLLALAGDEAELAGVLAHEIGHVTARHSAERYGQQVATNIAQLGLGLILGNGAITQAFGQAGAMALRSFSREQESEADKLGVRYLTRAGYDPGAMASFLGKLLADSRLDAEMRGEPGKADEFNIMQTHPRTADRIEAAMREAGVTSVAQPMRPRDIYLDKIDGILYGDNPDQGFVRGRRFLHPKLRFAFEVPDGFQLYNSSEAIIAAGPAGAGIVVGRTSGAGNGSMTAYLTRTWAKSVTLSDVEAITINGMPAATGYIQLQTSRGARDVRLVAIGYDRQTIYRMMFITLPDVTASMSRGFRDTTYSFRKLSADEAAALKPFRIRTHVVRPGETPESLAARMPFENYAVQRFQVLNGMEPGEALKPGQRVKLVAE